jgi:DNA-binding transcriptional LysR family regulator
MTTGSLRVPATGALADLLACPPPLLDVTLDQLRTLLAVREAGSPLAASRILGREHSSIRKQLDSLNHAFQQMCGETLVVKQGRGQDYLFTPTGEAMSQITADTLNNWLTGISERRRRLGATVTVATTEFTVDFLAQVWPSVAAEFTRREIELNIVHVRTRDFRAQLDAKDVDLVCGSIAASAGPDSALGAYDIIEWHRENLALVTNLPEHELPVSTVNQKRLPAIPLLAPAAGLIADFLRRWYGPGYRSQLHVVAEVDSIYYGLAILRTGLVRGAMICAHAAAQAVIDGRLPGGPGIRVVPLTSDYDPPLQLLAGIFARKGERELYDATHPLNLLWNAFNAHVRDRPMPGEA